MAETSAPPDTQAPEEQVEPVSFGLWWPAGDPGKLREAADAWDAMASHLDTATTMLSGAAAAVTGANSGAAIDAFAGHWDLIGGSRGALPAFAGECRNMATALREFADAVDEVREQITQMAIEIAATVAIGVGLAVFTFGASAGTAAAATSAMVARALTLCTNLGIRAVTITSRELLDNGSVRLSSKSPAKKVPGSYADYIKIIDKEGNTVQYVKTTYAPDGTIVHSKNKR